jgi:hypothetical protein
MSVIPMSTLCKLRNYPKTIARAGRATNPTVLPSILAAASVLLGAMAGEVDGPVGEDAGFVIVDVSVAELVVTLTRYKEPPLTMSASETALSVFAAAFAKAAWICSLDLHELGIHISVREYSWERLTLED